MVRLVKVFKVKNNINIINNKLDSIQLVHEDNRITNVQIVGSYAYITASVEVKF